MKPQRSGMGSPQKSCSALLIIHNCWKSTKFLVKCQMRMQFLFWRERVRGGYSIKGAYHITLKLEKEAVDTIDKLRSLLHYS